MQSRSFIDTEICAGNFVEKLKKRDDQATVVGLVGDLGSGKTTFVKGVAKALGIGTTVTSPTFVIEKVYKTDRTSFEHLVHIDAYRLEDSAELQTLGWDDILANPKHLVLIEWPERVQSVLPDDMLTITFTFVDEHTRDIVFPNGY